MNVWAGVDRLIDAAPEGAALTAHGIHLLAARRWRARGRSVPPEIVAEERASAALALAVPVLLRRVRDALDGPIVMFKGPEVAAHYPDPALRPFGDVDLLVEDAAAAQRRLIAAGFDAVEDYPLDHQQVPLRWPGSPLIVELHNYPPKLRWMTLPRNEELFASAVPSATGAPGILTLAPAAHAVIVATHAWGHNPLRRVLDLVDIAAVTEGTDRAETAEFAVRCGAGRVWATMIEATDALLSERHADTWPLRLWARHLRALRDRTVVEKHLMQLLGACWAPTPASVARSLALAVREEVRPLRGEAWGDKLGRIGRAARDAWSPTTGRQRDG